MALIPAIVDVQDSTGATLIVPNVDGTRSALALRLAATLAATYEKDGDTGIINLGLLGGSVPNFTTGYTLGGQTPPQYVAQVAPTATVTTGGANVLVGTVQVPVGKVVSFDLCVNASIILPTPGILLPGCFEAFVVCSSYGTSGTKVLGSTTDTGRTTATSPWIPTSVTLTPAGATAQIYAVPYSAPAFVSGNAYTGGFAGSTTLPNAIGNGSNSLVTNDSGKLYVCTVGGTDSSSGGPTGSGASAIVVGGLTWYYVGTAAAGVTSRITVTLNGIKTGG